jgi:hypothetical protein
MIQVLIGFIAGAAVMAFIDRVGRLARWLRLDDYKAEMLLGRLDNRGLPVWKGRCGICGKEPCDYHGHWPVPKDEL